MAHTEATAALFARRCLAYAIDCLLVLIVVIALVQGLLWLITGGGWFTSMRSWIAVQGWVVISVVVPTWLYFSLAESSPWQATLGKRFLGLRVSDVRGNRISLPHALTRNFLKLIPWFFVHVAILVPSASGASSLSAVPPSMSWWYGFLAIADGLMLVYLLTPLFTHGQRSIYDLIDGTRVTRQ